MQKVKKIWKKLINVLTLIDVNGNIIHVINM